MVNTSKSFRPFDTWGVSNLPCSSGIWRCHSEAENIDHAFHARKVTGFAEPIISRRSVVNAWKCHIFRIRRTSRRRLPVRTSALFLLWVLGTTATGTPKYVWRATVFVWNYFGKDLKLLITKTSNLKYFAWIGFQILLWAHLNRDYKGAGRWKVFNHWREHTSRSSRQWHPVVHHSNSKGHCRQRGCSRRETWF